MFQWFLTLSNLLHSHSSPNTTRPTYAALVLFEHEPASTLTFSVSAQRKCMHIWSVCAHQHFVLRDSDNTGTQRDTKMDWYLFQAYIQTDRTGGGTWNEDQPWFWAAGSQVHLFCIIRLRGGRDGFLVCVWNESVLWIFDCSLRFRAYLVDNTPQPWGSICTCTALYQDCFLIKSNYPQWF